MCDFENGLCTLKQGSGDTFDWNRARGKTTSIGTGPQTDHTFGTAEGKGCSYRSMILSVLESFFTSRLLQVLCKLNYFLPNLNTVW